MILDAVLMQVYEFDKDEVQEIIQNAKSKGYLNSLYDIAELRIELERLSNDA